MPRIAPILVVALLLLAVPAAAAGSEPYQAVFKACGIPEKAKNVDGLIQAGWRPVDRTMVANAMGRYLALANAKNLEEVENLKDWGLRLGKDSPFQDGDIFLTKEKSQDFLWLRYVGERLEACTLLGSTEARTDILLQEIWSCSDWHPVAQALNEIERWVCSKPSIFFVGYPEKKLTPSVALVPEHGDLKPKTLIFQVRT